MQSRTALIALIVITAIGGALRFATLGTESLWLDEAFTVNVVLHPDLGGTLGAIPDTGYTPHLYFVIAWFWSKAFGTGEFALRSISAIAGTATIPVGYAIGRELRSRGCGLLLAGFIALHGALYWYSQELRVYALFTFLVSLSFLFFLRSRRTEAPRDLAAWGIVSGIAVGTHYYSGIFVAVEAIWLLMASDHRRRVLLAWIPIAVVTLAYVPLAIHQAGIGQYSSFGPLGTRLGKFGETLFDPGYPAVAALAAAVSLVAVLLALRARPRTETGQLVFCLEVAAVVIAAPCLLALVGIDFFLARNLLPVTVVLLAAVAVAVSSLRGLTRIALGGAIVALLGISSISQLIGQSPQRPEWRAAADAVREHPGPQLVIGGEASGDPLTYYLPDGVGAEGSPTGDAIYRVRRVSQITECDRDLQGMLDATGSRCQGAGTHPFWLPPSFQTTAERRLGNVLVRTFETRRPTGVDATLAIAGRPGYAAYVLPTPATQGQVLVSR